MTRERRGYVRITCEVAERGRIDTRVAEDDQAMSVDDINDIEQRADRCEPVARAAEIDRGAEQTDGRAAGCLDCRLRSRSDIRSRRQRSGRPRT